MEMVLDGRARHRRFHLSTGSTYQLEGPIGLDLKRPPLKIAESWDAPGTIIVA